MTSDLSIFAARLRDFIAICAGEFASFSPEAEPALRACHDAEFNGLALVLFALQFDHNPAYRKICAARNVFPDAITHWTQIPAVPAAAFKELELSGFAIHECMAVFHSSGTTGQQPSRHFHSAESLAVYEASLWPWFAEHVAADVRRLHSNTIGQPAETGISQSLLTSAATPGLVILAPAPARVPHSSLVHMFEVVRRRLGAPASAFAGKIAVDGSWTLDFKAALAVLRATTENHEPLVLLGTAFSFVHLLDHLAENDLRFELPPGSHVMETGGYKGRSRSLPKTELHALITDRLGVPASHIICEYGMSELSSQAYDLKVSGAGCPVSGGDRVFRFPPWARVQIVSPETGREVAEGETGLLRIFDLANVFSVLAIQTEDLAIRRAEGFELIGRAELAELRGCSLLSEDSLIANSQQPTVDSQPKIL